MGGWEHGWQHQELGVRSPAQSFLLGTLARPLGPSEPSVFYV